MVYEKFVAAWENKDIKAYLDCDHENWQITFHSTGRIMRLEELSDQIGNGWLRVNLKNIAVCMKMKTSLLLTR